MIKAYLLTLTLFCTSHFLKAQNCINGNCDNGYGTLILNENERYEGLFQQGKFQGQGTLHYANKDRYEGNFENNLPNGKGFLISSKGAVKAGVWTNGELTQQDHSIRFVRECIKGDCQNGIGQLKDYKGRIYEGRFKNHQFEGYGTLRYTNGDYYKGRFLAGLPHGQGAYYYKNGHIDEGDWENGRFMSKTMRTWAVIVGIADYPDFPKLTYTIDDAKKIYAFLRSPEGGAIPQENARLLLNEEATKENILNTTFELFQQADSNDIIIFYFAGHGLEGAFVPYDYDNTEATLLLHNVLNNDFLDSKAKFKICIADACHSGSYAAAYDAQDQNLVASTRSIRDKIRQHYKSFENIKGGLAMIASSAAEEVSLEATKLKQGVFSYFFIQGLKGQADANENGVVTVTELYDYVHQQVQNYTHGFQKPLIFGNFDINMPMGLVHEIK